MRFNGRNRGDSALCGPPALRTGCPGSGAAAVVSLLQRDKEREKER